MTNSSSSQQGSTISTWVVDQMENGVASVEIDGKKTATVPIGILPKGVSEGDVLRVIIEQDPAELARRLAQSAAQIAKGRSGGKGNINL